MYCMINVTLHDTFVDINKIAIEWLRMCGLHSYTSGIHITKLIQWNSYFRSYFNSNVTNRNKFNKVLCVFVCVCARNEVGVQLNVSVTDPWSKKIAYEMNKSSVVGGLPLNLTKKRERRIHFESFDIDKAHKPI